MLRDEDKKQIKERLQTLKEPVNILFFTQELAGVCQYCRETGELLKEIAELSDLIHLKTYNFVTDKDQVKTYKIDKIPAIAIHGKEDTGIRYYGVPSGYEFATLLESLLMVSKDDSELDERTKSELNTISDKAHIKVFVTPTCPYCPQAALVANQFSFKNKNISAETIEISEFPHLAQKYAVMGVPKVVINEETSFEGALPQAVFLDHIKKALSNN